MCPPYPIWMVYAHKSAAAAAAQLTGPTPATEVWEVRVRHVYKWHSGDCSEVDEDFDETEPSSGLHVTERVDVWYVPLHVPERLVHGSGKATWGWDMVRKWKVRPDCNGPGYCDVWEPCELLSVQRVPVPSSK